MGVSNSSPTGMSPTDETPRTLYGTDVVIWESPGFLRFKWPYKGIMTQIAGMAWIGLIAVSFRSLTTIGVPSWILILIAAPGLSAVALGLSRAGRSMCFELGPNRFVARGLGLFARTNKAWNTSEILRFKSRNTTSVSQESSMALSGGQYPTGTFFEVRLIVELRSGKEEV